MNLYNVGIEASYSASYEGEIDKSYSRLVLAKTKEEAIEFVAKNIMGRNNNYNSEEVKDVHLIDFDEVKRKRVVGYYLP